MSEARLGVDVGGTFTDLVGVTDGTLTVRKVPSTPDAPDRGVGNALDAMAEPLRPEHGSFFAHGTTVATNAVLEEEWAAVALVTNEGFRDALEIGRQDRPDIYDPTTEKPTPIVPRDRRHEVPGRLDERGEELSPIDGTAVAAVADAIADGPAQAVAVSLLFSFEDDAHETAVRDELRAAGLEVPLSLSSRVLPEIREYERTLATALNAGLIPVVRQYLERLADRLADRDVPAEPTVMTSSGGLVAAADAARRPIQTLLSGPAAGVTGAAAVADSHDRGNLVTMDMGGTSCDVALVEDGDPVVGTETAVGEYPVAVPAVDIHTVGAGGGSIAHVDAGGALRVGPASAGARPGPVSYGRGGTEPTTTDAHALLGRLTPDRIVETPAGDDAIRTALDPVADALGTDTSSAAEGILRVANANLERALRVVTVERGRDPRELTLVAFGGAGPLHAPALAARLDIPRVLVPRAAGVLSAFGLLASDVQYDRSRSLVRGWQGLDPATLEVAYHGLERDGTERLEAADVDQAARRFERSADLRYRGQTHTVRVPVPNSIDGAAMTNIEERFHETHEDRYGHADPTEPLAIETVRLRAIGVVEAPSFPSVQSEGTPADAIRETRPVGFEDGRHSTPVYERASLPAGTTFDGPAVVEGPASTLCVPPEQTVSVDDVGHLMVAVAP